MLDLAKVLVWLALFCSFVCGLMQIALIFMDKKESTYITAKEDIGYMVKFVYLLLALAVATKYILG